MSKRVFVSSTFTDLQDYRESARQAVKRLGAEDVAMEHFGSREDRPKDECIRIVQEESEAFVGIYAHRYGFVPAGETISISEAEYEAAGMAGVPRFIYLIDEQAPWPQERVEGEPGRSKLEAFKERLKAAHICSPFSSKEDLAAKLSADLGRHFSDEIHRPVRGDGGLFHQPSAGWISPVPASRWRYKVVAFDLDGTLLRGDGFQFSWESIWSGLAFSMAVQQELRKEYRARASAAADPRVRIEAYRDWCRSACEHFKARKLTREKVRSLGEPLRLTRNFETALAKLRQERIVTALISGGIHCFLEDKVPEFRNWFDFVFINVLKFDANGLLTDVVATEFDFEGKRDALRMVADRAGCTMDETVFVGDGFNDEAILLAAGKGIAYPPKDQAVVGASQVLIQDDDLEQILEHVLVE
jgi:HAD superfamily phosphoserine phosphatase-like hydrolase